METPEEGATFEVYLTSAGSYAAAKETERDFLTIDKDGFARTKDLPVGNYTVHQVSGWEGSELIADFTVEISENDQTYSYIINNERFYAYLKVVKLDAITGKAVPQEGIGFQIYTPQGELVTFWGQDTWYSDEGGVVKIPVELEYGVGYKAVEMNAPAGYILATEPFSFSVLPEHAVMQDGLKVITLEAKNTPTQVQLRKVDPDGNGVSGAQLQLLDKTKPAEAVSDAQGAAPDWFQRGVEAALLAPTAVNQQKFKFTLHGNHVSAKAGTGFYSKVDLGIAKYHFEIGAGKDNFTWA